MGTESRGARGAGRGAGKRVRADLTQRRKGAKMQSLKPLRHRDTELQIILILIFAIIRVGEGVGGDAAGTVVGQLAFRSAENGTVNVEVGQAEVEMGLQESLKGRLSQFEGAEGPLMAPAQFGQGRLVAA